MLRSVRTWLTWSWWGLTLALILAALWLIHAAEAPPATSFVLGLVLGAFVSVGALVATRQPGNIIGGILCAASMLGALYLFAMGYATVTLVARPGSLPGGVWLAWIASWAGKAGFVLLFMFTLLLFPDGRLLSPRWRIAAWLSAAWLGLITAAAMLMPGTMNASYPSVRNPLGLESAAPLLDLILKLSNPGFVVVAALPAASLLARFRRARGEARQQLKWVAFASSLLLVWVGLDLALQSDPQFQPIDNGLLAVALISIPAAIGIAILKHRLYDIDLIIHRTLVYSLISALLVPIYFGSVVLLQAGFRVATGANSQIAIVLSTLAIAALFFPMRQRAQDFIDRRFFRRKYDAAQTLAEFGAAVRHETDLDRLAQQLVAVMQESLEPETVALWLKPTLDWKGLDDEPLNGTAPRR